VGAGTRVLFSRESFHSIFIDEQFWGRAARASGDSRESGRPLNFTGELLSRQLLR
jgi:hypothetical protein